jgi:hypothetical protein
MPSPTEWQVDDFTRRCNNIKGVQGFEDHGPLLQDVPRFTERMSEWPAQEHGSRRTYLLGEFPYDRYADGGNTGFFDLSLDQPHGLIADASGRRQQDHVDVVPVESFHHLLRRDRDQGGDMPAVYVAHERVMPVSQAADDPLPLQLA